MPLVVSVQTNEAVTLSRHLTQFCGDRHGQRRLSPHFEPFDNLREPDGIGPEHGPSLRPGPAISRDKRSVDVRSAQRDALFQKSRAFVHYRIEQGEKDFLVGKVFEPLPCLWRMVSIAFSARALGTGVSLE